MKDIKLHISNLGVMLNPVWVEELPGDQGTYQTWQHDVSQHILFSGHFAYVLLKMLRRCCITAFLMGSANPASFCHWHHVDCFWHW